MADGYRTERDSLGEMQVPADALYGAQTQRAVENFPISGQRFGRRFIQALGLIKKSAAETNLELGNLDERIADTEAQVEAAEELIEAQPEEPEESKELVVDLGELEDEPPAEEAVAEETRSAPPQPSPHEPALAGVDEKSGFMGAVRAAFNRTSRDHVHDFTEAPGGIGIVRYICRECGYVSIST